MAVRLRERVPLAVAVILGVGAQESFEARIWMELPVLKAIGVQVTASSTLTNEPRGTAKPDEGASAYWTLNQMTAPET